LFDKFDEKIDVFDGNTYFEGNRQTCIWQQKIPRKHKKKLALGNAGKFFGI